MSTCDTTTRPATVADAGTSVTALVTGIVNDAQELMKQQFALFRHEVKTDLRKTTNAVLLLAVGAVVAFVGVVHLTTMLAYLLHERAGLELWAGFGIVGLALAAAGALLLFQGKHKLTSFNPLPDESLRELQTTVREIKEAL